VSAAPQSNGSGRFGRLLLLVLALLSLAAIAAVVLRSGSAGGDAATIIRTVSLPPSQVPPGQILDRADDLAAWALDAAHAASEETDAELRARLVARFAAGSGVAALESGVISADGLDTAETGFHEAEVLVSEAARDGDTVLIDATWRPVSLLPGEDHRHQLGNTFTGTLELTWTDRAWRLTGIDIAAMDTSEAGRIVAAPQE
jgi:hypothetical protein